jgi:ribosomal protein L7/L12
MPEFLPVLNSLVLVSVILMILSTAITGARTATLVAAVNRKLDLLLKQAGVDIQPIMRAEVETLLRAGKKIDAIKVYREFTGAGLADAKAAVEKMQEGA